MEFTCDPIKNQTNIESRALPLLAAQVMFNEDLLVIEDTRKPYPERRFIGYNTIDGRLMVMVFCRPDNNQTRIISLRKANDREQKKFTQSR
ncbi:MAG: BrnT family toxin [Methylococcales bacterium]